MGVTLTSLREEQRSCVASPPARAHVLREVKASCEVFPGCVVFLLLGGQVKSEKRESVARQQPSIEEGDEEDGEDDGEDGGSAALPPAPSGRSGGGGGGGGGASSSAAVHPRRSLEPGERTARRASGAAFVYTPPPQVRQFGLGGVAQRTWVVPVFFCFFAP